MSTEGGENPNYRRALGEMTQHIRQHQPGTSGAEAERMARESVRRLHARQIDNPGHKPRKDR